MPIHVMALEFVARVEVVVGASTSHTRIVRLLSVCAWHTTLVILVDDAITILTSPGDRIRRADTLDTCSAIGVWLLARRACRASPVVNAHDIRLRTLLALARDAVLSAGACLARGAIGVGALACTASEATGRTNIVDVRDLWSLARLARRRPSVRESTGWTSRALGVGQATSGACLARDAKEALVVRKG